MKEYTHEYADFYYYNPTKLDREINVWPVRAGCNIAKPHYAVGPRRIECCSMHFVREGKLRLKVNTETFELEQGDMFCMFPGYSYSYHTSALDIMLRMYWVVFDGHKAEELLMMMGCTPLSPCLRNVFHPELEQTIVSFMEIMKQNQVQTTSSYFELQSLLYRIFAGISPTGVPVEDRNKAGWVQQAINYMHLHSLEGISIEQVADFVGLNRTYFSTNFVQQVGVSPKQYLQKIRMHKAKALLQESDASVTEVAVTLGYPNLYSFTRAFKHYYALSPSEYRGTKVGRQSLRNLAVRHSVSQSKGCGNDKQIVPKQLLTL